MIAFRQIQVLVTLANNISQESALTSLIIAGIAGISTGLAMLIRIPWTSDNIIKLFIFMCCTINGFLILLVCLGGMVAVHRESKHLLQKTKRTHHYTGKSQMERKMYRKFWRCCAVTKIKFGGTNYVEELTPVNCLNFSINVTVQFLLLGG